MALIQVMTGALLLAPLVPWHSLPVAHDAWAALLTLGVVHTVSESERAVAARPPFNQCGARGMVLSRSSGLM